MIECRTKGIPMREGTRVDDEGYHVFALDEAKHDPFDVFCKLVDAARKQHVGEYIEERVDLTKAREQRFNAVMLARSSGVSYELALARVKLGA